jgi:hypothetical protein
MGFSLQICFLILCVTSVYAKFKTHDFTNEGNVNTPVLPTASAMPFFVVVVGIVLGLGLTMWSECVCREHCMNLLSIFYSRAMGGNSTGDCPC